MSSEGSGPFLQHFRALSHGKDPAPFRSASAPHGIYVCSSVVLVVVFEVVIWLSAMRESVGSGPVMNRVREAQGLSAAGMGG